MTGLGIQAGRTAPGMTESQNRDIQLKLRSGPEDRTLAVAPRAPDSLVFNTSVSALTSPGLSQHTEGGNSHLAAPPCSALFLELFLQSVPLPSPFPP